MVDWIAPIKTSTMKVHRDEAAAAKTAVASLVIQRVIVPEAGRFFPDRME